ncbi:SDR family NAD(P)-dependent oxidoreductase [Flammeovirga sp. EKP202]|uniref:SDR family NAD(P)-dependent oxidoreductase n=1 Tax=Flammeovirga sp. EKP202 TaxID=2770592 RepID=UPI00165F9164|nr:SDR family NAD(P)-dependent oxidoreductase [Flammeovirga sp. EKP202]MBD0401573.1 SDR family NAD(P)-dependent oxidoreductase [Flammeovirga sp. EKP202]
MKYYNNKNIFITGGTSGIGLEMGKQLSSFGANIVLFGRKNLEETCEIVQSKRVDNSVHSILMETTDLSSVQYGFGEGVKAIGTPHIVIHSAGIGRCVPFIDFPKEDFEQVINVNVFGSRNVAEVSFEYLKKTKGQLMFIVSLAGIVTNYGYSAYSSSKYATLGLAGVLRSEWKPFGIHITAACPPEIDTPLVEMEKKESPKVSKILKNFAGNLPLDYACRSMLKGLSKQKYIVIPGFKAKFVNITQHLVPKLNYLISDFIISRYIKS